MKDFFAKKETYEKLICYNEKRQVSMLFERAILLVYYYH
jgi:hypothetical protein